MLNPEDKKPPLEIVELTPAEHKDQDRTRRGKENFLYFLKESAGMIRASCKYAGIALSTYYDWRKSDREFAEKCDEIMNEELQFVRDKLKEQIHKNNITAIIFYLKSKDPDFRQQVIHSEKTLEDFISEYEALETNNEESKEKLDAQTGQQGADTNALQDTGQEEAGS